MLCANGQIYAVSYKANSSTDAVTYYYAHNWRGDITSIYDRDGNMVAKYEYDVWGNVLTVTDANNKSITDKNHIANLNPFRYRSYYYDSESGLYYLMSRYYDPVVHRFLNADGIGTPGIKHMPEVLILLLGKARNLMYLILLKILINL